MYTISETAKMLGVSVPTLRRWEKAGKLPALKTLSGHRRYPERYSHHSRTRVKDGRRAYQ